MEAAHPNGREHHRGTTGVTFVARAAPAAGSAARGSDATIAYSEKGGGVSLMRYDANGAWTGPFVVSGLTGMTWVGAGELP